MILWFLFFIPVSMCSQIRYSVVIDEIMADPNPQVGLPNYEWLELKNTSAAPVNLQNWRIGDANGESGPMPNFLLLPDSIVIVCTGSAVPMLSTFGTTISVTSFPSLDNNDDLLYLKAANGRMIHAVHYSLAWYRNEVKQDGGWTLEMIDPANPCSGSSNWMASIHSNGGTPGKINSINGVNADIIAPQLKRAYTTDSITIILVYDEPVDSLSGATLTSYNIDGNLTLLSAVTLPPLFNTVQLKSSSPLQLNTVYTITANHVRDCNNNTIGSQSKARVGLPVDPVNGEWIINEVLFDPRINGFDYVEFFNNSERIFDASRLYIANRNSSGVISSIKVLSGVPFYIFPGDHIVVTEDAGNLALQYLVRHPDNVLIVSSPPSFPDDEGKVIALNFQGAVVDEVYYKDDWHFKLLDNDEGVSLERIDPAEASQKESNWHSAASTAGYGTPTYKNSQYKLLTSSQAKLEIVPKVFSPDNDGRDDVASIQYTMSEPGYIANITIYEVSGRPVRYLVHNGILGLNGYWNWDGLDDKGGRLPVGMYIVYTEMFNLAGKKIQVKRVVVLARKL